ncbi:MAG: hypothetical protein JXQ29_13855 [Planctomycetes bacterium]|nr:hypothetical protein [Planctomycetota bacterium]
MASVPAGPAATEATPGLAALPSWRHPTVLQLRFIHSQQELLGVESGRHAASLRALAARTDAVKIGLVRIQMLHEDRAVACRPPIGKVDAAVNEPGLRENDADRGRRVRTEEARNRDQA